MNRPGKNIRIPLLSCLTAICFFHLSFIFPDKIPSARNEKNIFWTVGKDGEIRKWQLESDSVTGGELAAQQRSYQEGNMICCGLAWCNANGNQPEFVLMSDDISKGRIYFHTTEESAFFTADESPGSDFSNTGGFGKFLYFQKTGSKEHPAALILRKGDSFKTVAELKKGEGFGAADIAVDTLGRAWVLIGSSSNYDTTDQRLCCYTPEGKLVISVPVSGISQMHAYGMMLLNGTIYVAFGASNKLFPNQLVPLVPAGMELKPGSPIPFKATGHDLASLYPGAPEIIKTIDPSNQPTLKIGPVAPPLKIQQ